MHQKSLIRRMVVALMVAAMIVAPGGLGLHGPAMAESADSEVRLPNMSPEDPDLLEEPQETQEPEVVEEPEEVLAIETGYLTLTYPAAYAQDVIIDVAELQGSCRLTARATLDGVELTLFSIMLSAEEAEGFRLGALQDAAGGAVGVYLLMNEQRAEDWSEEAFQQINLWQESINVLLMQIHENEAFVPGA